MTDLAEIIQDDEPIERGLTLFGTDSPQEVIAKATAIAQPLADLIRKQGLVTSIRGRDHVRVEGWTLLGSMLGVFPVTEWTKELPDGWEARVVATTLTGAVVGAAEAECRRTESTWKDRDSYALRSMAQTRATSKALRLPLGFVMTLAGFDPTPAEEMTHDDRAAASTSEHQCPSCGSAVVDNRAANAAWVEVADKKDANGKGRPPAWSCSNRDCQGGSKKRGGGNWPWGSYDADEFDGLEGSEQRDDVVEEMYRKVQRQSGAVRDDAEGAVFSAATELGFGWPTTTLDRDALNAVLVRAVEIAATYAPYEEGK